jgi:hypothetical protein
MLLPLLLALQATNGAPPVYHGRSGQKDAAIPRIEATARVDGNLDEPVWSSAARLTGFSQYLPVDGRPAEDSSEVLVWYAPDAIWFGVRAFEEHGSVVRATLADRDNISADDHVQILLDTFNDRRRALVFAVNPLGVQQDGVRSEGLAGAAGGQNAGFRFDGVVDLNPDYVFESRGRVTPQGYEIEVRIPFKSLRYQGSATQDWGLQLVRVTQHSAYEDTWTPVVRANASYLIQAGRLVGLTGLRRGLVMDLTPEYTTRVDGAPTTTDYAYGKVEPSLGGTARWGLTQNLSLTATVNPDFSQVEADVGQVTVNERFALFFPEKRPFFLEGLEQFDTPNTLIYMRRVQAPLAGVKLTGKTGRTAIAYLAAVDDDDLYAGAKNPVYNLLRLRRDLGQASHMGLAYTDFIDGAAYNRVLGIDTRLVWRTIWFSDAQLVGSWTRDGAGAERFGHIWNVTFYDRTGRNYGNHGELIGISPEFVARSGFVNRAGAHLQPVLGLRPARRVLRADHHVHRIRADLAVPGARPEHPRRQRVTDGALHHARRLGRQLQLAQSAPALRAGRVRVARGGQQRDRAAVRRAARFVQPLGGECRREHAESRPDRQLRDRVRRAPGVRRGEPRQRVRGQPGRGLAADRRAARRSQLAAPAPRTGR